MKTAGGDIVSIITELMSIMILHGSKALSQSSSSSGIYVCHVMTGGLSLEIPSKVLLWMTMMDIVIKPS